MQAITTKFLPATNTLGDRIKVTSWLGSKTYPYVYADNPHTIVFYEYLTHINSLTGNEFELVAEGNLPDGTGYVFIIK